VAPTRELAAQINDSFSTYGRFCGLKNYAVFGGVGKSNQIHALAKGVDILIATPGRLLDLISDGALSLQKVEIAVFDEADRMLDMGFIRDVRKIVTMLPKKRQTLLFSATMEKEIEAFNFDMPSEPETYVHRIGRTARAGAEGTAISFCDNEEKKLLKQVERLIKKQIPVERAV